MIKGKSILIAAAVLGAIILGACSPPPGVIIGDRDQPSGVKTITVDNPADFITELGNIAIKSGRYILNFTDGGNAVYTNTDAEPDIALAANVRITIRGTGSETITWNNTETATPLFRVNSGASLILEDIYVDGDAGNTPASYLIDNSGGTVEIREGTTLNYNTGNANDAVILQSGSFTMSGGAITAANGNGINGTGTGNFTMSDGTIDADTGIDINGSGKFTISGGTVTASTGTGIDITGSGDFTMSGGTVTATAGTGIDINTSDISVEIDGEIIGSPDGIEINGNNNKVTILSGADITGITNALVATGVSDNIITIKPGATISGLVAVDEPQNTLID